MSGFEPEPTGHEAAVLYLLHHIAFADNWYKIKKGYYTYLLFIKIGTLYIIKKIRLFYFYTYFYCTLQGDIMIIY